MTILHRADFSTFSIAARWSKVYRNLGAASVRTAARERQNRHNRQGAVLEVGDFSPIVTNGQPLDNVRRGLLRQQLHMAVDKTHHRAGRMGGDKRIVEARAA